MRPSSMAVAWAFAACTAHAQIMPLDLDWREAEAPPPPALKRDGLVPLEMPGSSLNFGIDPASIKIGADGVVRYVVVATSNTGAVNAMYEGIRCGTGEFRVYARHNPDSGWTMAKDSPWRVLRDTPASRHSMVFARGGACKGNSVNRSPTEILRDLRTGQYSRFGE